MAMRFFNKGTKYAVAIAWVLTLAACAGQKTEKRTDTAPIAAFLAEKALQQVQKNTPPPAPAPVTNSVVLQIEETQQYLPKQQYNKLGEKVIYIPAPNPYLSQTGVVAKASVDLFITARRDFKANRFEQAKKTLSKLVTLDSSLSGPLVMLGKIEERNNDIEAALKRYQQALIINPNNVNSYIGLARMQRVAGKYVLAQNTYAKALAIWKDFPEAHANLAVIYDLYLNKSELAIKHLQAHQFITQNKNKKITKWLTEIQQRTGISNDFIDNTPMRKKVNKAPVVKASSATQAKGTSL